jgi:hypothetical protein
MKRHPRAADPLMMALTVLAGLGVIGAVVLRRPIEGFLFLGTFIVMASQVRRPWNQ